MKYKPVLLELKEVSHHNRQRVLGITLVELFAALASVAIVLSFASAPLERMSARVDVDIAHANISNMLNIAQRAAAKHQMPVVISVTKRFGRTHLEAAYSYRWRNLRLDYIPPYSLPPSVGAMLNNGRTVIELEKHGLADNDQVIQLYSEVNPDYRVSVMVAGTNDVGK